jgi:23S rRNA (cytidine1920-2'-O)/16S rRNA (cytidine1409-2'-O)-methyltransferase
VKPQKKPLLQLLHTQYPDENREVLFSYILCGDVFVDGVKEKDPKAKVSTQAILTLGPERWVSRGGKKLHGLLEKWDWKVQDKVILDAGSSTGGFVQALLKKGAKFVYAVDVGKNQLDYSLRTNPKVRVMEETNARFLPELELRPQGATADLSFRGLAGVAGALLESVSEDWLLALVKPQFEYDASEDPDFTGVITDPKIIPGILEKTRLSLLEENVHLWDCAISRPKGRKGNREYFFLLKKEKGPDQKQWLAIFQELIQSEG